MYTLQWKNPTLPGKSPIAVPVTATVSNAASLTFTGKGAPNYGQIQQTNLLRLLENFADGVAPLNPTIGQTWFDSTNGVLSVCTSISPITWETLAGIQVTAAGVPPTSPSVGDMWFERFDHSGFLYVYTGLGRYPASNWNAHTAWYYPAVSPLVAPYLNIKINFGSFSVANFSEAYIHGFTGSTPTDTDGQININGVLTNVPRGALVTNFPGKHAIVWDTTSTMVSTVPGTTFFAVRAVGDNKFEYDDNQKWVTVVPAFGMHLIGFVDVAETDDNNPPGIASAEVWTDAIPFNNPNIQLPPLTGTGAAGGWCQIWPTVEHFGARFEYDAMMEKLLQLVGSPYTFGGNSALRGLGVTNFSIIDSSIEAMAYVADRDTNVGPLNDSSLVASEPTADDWDRLLSSSRWAVSRLDLPPTMVSSISQVPFTQDGRVASADLQALSPFDPRYPGEARRYARRWGSITGARLYAETMNALNAAISQRYTLKGIAGQNSTITALSNDVATYTHATHTAAYGGGGYVDQVVEFRFENNEEAYAFQYGGSAIDLQLGYTLPGSPTANDTTFLSFVNTYATTRITADKVRFFGNSLPLSMTSAPVAGGFNAAGNNGVFVNVGTITSGASSIVVAVARSGATVSVRLRLTAPSIISGTTTLAHKVVRDTQTFGAAKPFFQAPLPFVPGTDSAGSNPVWIYGVVTPAPIANFTLTPNPASGNPASVILLDTSGNSPTSIDWDFTNDGSFDLTQGPGASTVQSYSPGTHAVRLRATNAFGSNTITKTLTVNAPVTAPTISLIPGPITAAAGIANASFVVGTYTGTITSVVLNSGPGLSFNYNFSGGTITYQGPLYLSNSGTAISLTVSNAGGSVTATSGVLTVTPIGFSVNTTNWAFPSGSLINAFIAPRKTIAACVTPDNHISNGSVASGSIPPGTSLQFNQGGNGDVIILGTPTTPGSYQFQLQVQDGFVSGSPGTTTTGVITITINGPFVMTPTSVTRTYTVGQVVTLDLVASFTGATGGIDINTITSGTPPPGISTQTTAFLDTGSVWLSGTATTPGVYTWTQLFDTSFTPPGNGQTSITFTVTVV